MTAPRWFSFSISGKASSSILHYLILQGAAHSSQRHVILIVFKPAAKLQPRILHLASRDFSFVDFPQVDNRLLSAYEASII
jgi:hypothetical protein